MPTKTCSSGCLRLPSVGLILFALAACDPATPHPASSSVVVDAAVDRVLLGVGGAPPCNNAHPSNGAATGGAAGAPNGGGGGGAGSAGSAGGEPDAGADARPVDAGKSDAGVDASSSATGGGGGGTTGAGSGGTGNAGGARGGSTGASGGSAGGGRAANSGGDGAGGEGPASGGAAGKSGSAGAGAAQVGGAGGGGAPGAGGGGAGGTVPSAPAPQHGELAIVELLINPASTDTGREWIEIVNRTSHALDLSMLHIADAANDAAIDFGGLPPVLSGGGRAILIQSADIAKNGGINLAMTWGGSFGTRVSLNNDADTMTVCIGPCATGVVVDQVSWDATLQGDYDGHALVIDDAGHRCPASAPFGDAASFGTPGTPNAACP